MILTKPSGPAWAESHDLLADLGPLIELDAVALAVIETDRFDMIEAGKRPGETGRRILPSGKKHERFRHDDRLFYFRSREQSN